MKHEDTTMNTTLTYAYACIDATGEVYLPNDVYEALPEVDRQELADYANYLGADIICL